MKLKNYELPSKFTDILKEDIPAKLIKDKPGGKKGLKYVAGYVVVKYLNDISNYMWDWEIIKHWYEKSTDILNSDKEMIVCYVLGRLTVHLTNDKGEQIKIVKEAPGTKICFYPNDLENSLKSASTDALKKAASYLGVASQIYMDEEEYYTIKEIEEITKEEEQYAFLEQEYKEEFKIINQFKKVHNASNEQLNGLVKELFNNKYTKLIQLNGDNFKILIQELKKYL